MRNRKHDTLSQALSALRKQIDRGKSQPTEAPEALKLGDIKLWPGAFQHRDAWLFGVAIVNWVLWQLASVVGIVGGAFIPTSWGLQFAGTLALLPLVLPACRSWAGASGALTAGSVALLGNGWPYKSGLLVGVVAGILVATIVDGLTGNERVEGRP